jgi:exonuclease III
MSDAQDALCNNSVYYNGEEISIRCWNVDGRLAANLTRPDFLAELEEYDINFFQETHLYPSQEETLPLPSGYDVFAVAREPSAQFKKQGGGVAAIFRRSLPVEMDAKLSGPDLLVLNIGVVSLFCAYILPMRAAWSGWSEVHPMDKLNESLAIARERGNSIFVIGDLNGRTGSRRVSNTHPSRFSLDEKVNSRGLDILRMGEEHDLRILNGDLTFGDGSWGWTYCKERDGVWCTSVIDYAMCSVLASSMVKSFEVCRVGPWSDHAPVILKLAIPNVPILQNPGLPYIRERRLAAEESNGYLDCLLRDTLAEEQCPEEKRNLFYGPVYSGSSQGPVMVYTDGSCLKNGSTGARAGAGITVLCSFTKFPNSISNKCRVFRSGPMVGDFCEKSVFLASTVSRHQFIV